MKIYLLRHGQTLRRVADQAAGELFDPGLDETGMRQADLLGQRLRSYSIEALYSSDLERAKQTALIANRYLRTDILFAPQLREIDMGAIPGKGWEAYPEVYAEWLQHETDLPYPQGEAGRDVHKRVWPVIEEIASRHIKGAVVVTHGGVIMVLLSACLGMGLEKRFRFSTIAHCSISTLVYDTGRKSMQVECVNDTAHLEHPQPGADL